MINAYKLGVESLTPILEKILSPGELNELQTLLKADKREFVFPDDLWVRLVYRYALAFHGRIWPTEQLMKAMIPLYMGRTASFVIANMEASAVQVEQNIESLCQCFEVNKPLLVQEWGNQR